MHAAVFGTFQQVRQILFPRWDRRGAWRLQVEESLPCFGCCDFEAHTISVRPVPVGDGLRLLLIHEICHCCAGKGHGKKWLACMLKAAVRAAHVGMQDLSRMLKDEVATAAALGSTVRAGDVYSAIRACAVDFPMSSFDEIKGMVCRQLCLCVEEFEKTYRRARQIFDQAR